MTAQEEVVTTARCRRPGGGDGPVVVTAEAHGRGEAVMGSAGVQVRQRRRRCQPGEAVMMGECTR